MPRRPLLAPVLVGVGLIGTLDEVLLHQVLHWHHFYDVTTDLRDPTTSRVGLLTDGIFHVVSTFLLVWGVLTLRRVPRFRSDLVGGILIGAGGFNLYDGVVQHKLLRLHQVREGAHPETPYDIAFIGLALLTVAAGMLTVRRGRAARMQSTSARDFERDH
jgi:uncharacterized membrane protein